MAEMTEPNRWTPTVNHTAHLGSEPCALCGKPACEHYGMSMFCEPRDVVYGYNNTAFCLLCGFRSDFHPGHAERMERCSRSHLDGLGDPAECIPFIEGFEEQKLARATKPRLQFWASIREGFLQSQKDFWRLITFRWKN
jgi:hypothetical protein